MARFRIIRTTDPAPYEKEMERLLRENLPGTAPGRFEWMKEGNPAGPATWFLAFDEAKDVLAGTISVMPKTLSMKGRPIHSGIMGDLMVDKRYRVFGPVMQLPKAVLGSLSDLGIEFLYTIPNRASVKILERNRFTHLTTFETYVRPISLASYLVDYSILSSRGVHALANVERFITRILQGLIGEIGGFFDDGAQIDESLGQLYQEFMMRNPLMIIGERGVNYLRWRYIENPQYDFRILTYRSSKDEPISGYLVYSMNSNKLELYDLVYLSDEIAGRLIKKIIRIAQSEAYKAVLVSINQLMPLSGILRRHLFVKNKDRFEIYCPADVTTPPERLYFLAGDRNL